MFRPILIFVLTLLCWAGTLSVLTASQDARSFYTRGIEDPLTAEALPYRVPRLGVTAELTAFPAEELYHQLDLMQQAGIRWVRQYAYWDVLENEQGQYNWHILDPIVEAITQHPNLELILVLQNTPAWAIDPAAVDPTGPPRHPADFAAFAGAIAARYADSVTYYQVWDEPNLFTNWGRIAPQTARYAAMLEGAYAAIHAADPQAQVISAALAPTIETGPDNISDWLYLENLYALGAAAFMDAVGAKPYGFDFAADDRRVEPRLLNFSRVIGLREIMLRSGDGHKAIWGSHWGWNHLPPDWTGAPSTWGAVSQQQQIDYTLGALARIETEWPWMAGMTLHHWNPPYPADHPQQGFALVTPQGQPTPLLQALIDAHTAHPTHAGIGWHPAKTPYAQYSGVWTFTDYGADVGWNNDSKASFRFEASAVGVIVRQDDYVAYLYPTVDGQPANALPRDAAGSSYLVLTSARLRPITSVVPIAQGLNTGTHTLEFTADRGFDRYALIGFAVGAGNLAAPYDSQVYVAFTAFLVMSGALAYSVVYLPWQNWNRHLSGFWRGLRWPIQLAAGAAASIAVMVGILMAWGQELPAIFRREEILPSIGLLSLGLVYINSAVPLTVIALAVLFWCIYHRLLLGAALTLMFAPFFLFPVELYRFAFPLAEILVLLTAAAGSLRFFVLWGRNHRAGKSLPQWIPKPCLHPLDLLAVLYLTIGTLALFWSLYRAEANTEYRVLFIEPVLLYAIIRICSHTKSDHQYLVIALLSGGVLASIISLSQYALGQTIITAEDESLRLAGIYGSPNNLALLMGRIIPFMFAAVLMTNRPKTRLLSGLALGVSGVTALLTQSVGGIFIGIPLALAVVLIMAVGRRGWLYLALVVGILAIGFMLAASQSERFARALDFSQGTNFYRVRVMQSALQIIQQHPITGLGLDQFLYAFRDTYIYPDAWPEPNLSHPHNILLDFWVRLGIMGAALLVGFIICTVRAVQHIWKERHVTPIWSWIIPGLVGSLVNTLAHGLLDNSIFVPDLALIFFASIALIVSLERRLVYDKLLPAAPPTST
jgi:O-antigen ligase